jgi:hypothetical protein
MERHLSRRLYLTDEDYDVCNSIKSTAVVSKSATSMRAKIRAIERDTELKSGRDNNILYHTPPYLSKAYNLLPALPTAVMRRN